MNQSFIKTFGRKFCSMLLVATLTLSTLGTALADYNFTTLRENSTPSTFLSSTSSHLRLSLGNIPNNNYQLKGFEDDFMYLLEVGNGSHYAQYNDRDYWENYYEDAANALDNINSY